MELLQVMGAAWLSKSVSVAATLGLADHLGGEAMSMEDLAQASGAHVESLSRLVRVLATFGIFQFTPGGLIENSPSSACLKSGHPLSMRHFCMLAGEEYYDGWGALLHTVKTGEPGFVQVFGSSIYDYMDRHPERAKVYDSAMADLSRPVGALLAREYAERFHAARRVVDIGGGSGIVTRQVLRAYGHLSGTVFDREDVCLRAQADLDSDLQGRLTYRAGDFFGGVPADGDIYVLKNVLHNWNAESSKRILDNIATAMRTRAAVQDSIAPRLLVVEPLVEHSEKSPRLVMNALFQIVICQEGTRDRTRAEMEDMLTQSSMRIDGYKTLATGHTVLEVALR